MNYFAIPGLKPESQLHKYKKRILDKPVNSHAVVYLKFLTTDDYFDVIEKHYGLSKEKVIKKTRRSDVHMARSVLYFMLRKYCPEGTLSKIAVMTGTLQDHTTVLNCLRKISDLTQTDSEFRDKLKRIESDLNILNVSKYSSRAA